jgi:hypothetical protein
VSQIVRELLAVFLRLCSDSRLTEAIFLSIDPLRAFSGGGDLFADRHCAALTRCFQAAALCEIVMQTWSRRRNEITNQEVKRLKRLFWAQGDIQAARELCEHALQNEANMDGWKWRAMETGIVVS